jgi:L-serine dehydratase
MISFFELFKIGIGPSSSHTVGPMKAAAAFIEARRDAGELDQIARIFTTLYRRWPGPARGTAPTKQ